MTVERSILKSPDIKIGIRFGFLGLGMGGSSIAAACANIKTKVTNNNFPYNGLLVNTNEIDLEKIESVNPNIKKLIIGTGKGAGRNMHVGEQMFKDNAELVEKDMIQTLGNSDFIWIVAGLGGGTGTGSVIEAIRLLMKNGFQNRFGLILTLPRNNEGQTVLQNAMERLKKIHKAINGLGSVILVDNQKLYDYFVLEKPESTIAEYLQFTNEFIAETLHELNIVTASYNPYGETHFDTSEFENLIKTPGYLHFARFTSKSNEVDTSQFITHVGKLKRNIEEGVLSDGYDLTNTTRLAISILANENTAKRVFNFDFLSSIEKQINEIAPLANEKPIAEYSVPSKDMKDIYFYSVFAGLKLPKRVSELVTETNRLIELKNNQQQDEEDIFASLSSPAAANSNNLQVEKSFDDLFGDDSDSEAPKKEVSVDDLFD